MIRKFDNFINEKAPVNMDFYNKQENVPFFDEDQLSSLASIGFNHVTKHYATMMEGDYLIKALPIMTGKQHKWLHKILIKIYLIDKNGRPEFIEKGEFFVRSIIVWETLDVTGLVLSAQLVQSMLDFDPI